MNPPDASHEKVTVPLHSLPEHIEEGLIERAAANGRDPAAEAAAIIARYVEENGDEII